MTDTRNEFVSIQMASAIGIGLFAQFWKHDDRYHHELGLITGEQKTVLLSSIEGSPNDFWPSCPPIQQLYKQTVDENPVVLGVGMAGSRHYSTSVLLQPTESSVQLIVESACLIKDPPGNDGKMGTRYQTHQNWSQVELGIQSATIAGCESFIEPITTTQYTIDSDSNQLWLHANQFESGRATQWGYKLGLAGSRI